MPPVDRLSTLADLQELHRRSFFLALPELAWNELCLGPASQHQQSTLQAQRVCQTHLLMCLSLTVQALVWQVPAYLPVPLPKPGQSAPSAVPNQFQIPSGCPKVLHSWPTLWVRALAMLQGLQWAPAAKV